MNQDQLIFLAIYSASATAALCGIAAPLADRFSNKSAAALSILAGLSPLPPALLHFTGTWLWRTGLADFISPFDLVELPLPIQPLAAFQYLAVRAAGPLFGISLLFYGLARRNRLRAPIWISLLGLVSGLGATALMLFFIRIII